MAGPPRRTRVATRGAYRWRLRVADDSILSVSSFSEVEGVWSERLGNLRNVVRQQVIHHQLMDHTATVRSALDVGCGQGTQAIELAAKGIDVTGLDPSRPLLDELAATANKRGVTVKTHQGTLDDLDQLVGGRTYDLVTAHGLLMYLDDVTAWCEDSGLTVERWYGVRVLTDGASAEEMPEPTARRKTSVAHRIPLNRPCVPRYPSPCGYRFG